MTYQIVVGVDGSENGANALRHAIEVAQLRGAEVTALFAWQFPLIGIPGAFDQQQLEDEAKKFLVNEVAAVDPPAEVTVTHIVAQGDPSESLLQACHRVGADLLVIGARGREGFTGLMLGSVGQECAVHAPCSVAIIKPDGHKPPRSAG